MRTTSLDKKLKIREKERILNRLQPSTQKDTSWGDLDPHTDIYLNMYVSHITQPKLERRNMLWLVLSVPNTSTVP